MDDRSPTAASSPTSGHDEADPGVVVEVVDSLNDLAPDADFEVGEALVAAAESFRAEMAELHAAAVGAVTIEVGASRHALRLGDELVVGRQGPHIVDHPMVSRRHVAVAHGPRGVHVRDLGSANGSWVVRGNERLPITGDGLVLLPADHVVTAGDVTLLSVDPGMVLQ
jgi:hypothetical protein